MEPYQKASQESQRQANLPLELGKKSLAVGSAAASAYAGGAAISRVLPFLNQYIPEDLAIKGLNKIDPRFGKFIEKAQQSGESFDSIKDFLSGKVDEGLKAQENRSIIEQYSPELHQFIDQAIKGGESPIAAASKASRSKKFEKEINKLVHDHKLDWTSIVESVFGKGGKAPIQSQEAQQPQQAQQQSQGQGLDPEVAQMMQEGQAILQKYGAGKQ